MARKLWTLIAVVLVALAVVIPCLRAGETSAASSYQVLAPIRHGNLTIFPVLSTNSHDTHEFLTLDEGLRSGEVVVTESGKVSPLVRPRHSTGVWDESRRNDGAEVKIDLARDYGGHANRNDGRRNGAMNKVLILAMGGAGGDMHPLMAAAIDRMFQAAVDKREIPGVVAAVVNKDQILYLEAFGKQDVANGVPMSRDTVFRIASFQGDGRQGPGKSLVRGGEFADRDGARSFPIGKRDRGSNKFVCRSNPEQ